MGREELKRLDRLFSYVSTHRMLSIICCAQDFFSNLPPPIRRMSNVFFLWKTKDLDSLKTIGRRVGLQKEEMMYLMSKLQNPRDCLVLDNTFNSPYPIRLNGFTIIDSLKNNNHSIG